MQTFILIQNVPISARLHEARRLLMSEGADAAAVAHRVGYESPSQFNREYRRLFGAPPRREIASLRELSL
jgi:AraC-like DNA-binding protein